MSVGICVWAGSGEHGPEARPAEVVQRDLRFDVGLAKQVRAGPWEIDLREFHRDDRLGSTDLRSRQVPYNAALDGLVRRSREDRPWRRGSTMSKDNRIPGPPRRLVFHRLASSAPAASQTSRRTLRGTRAPSAREQRESLCGSDAFGLQTSVAANTERLGRASGSDRRWRAPSPRGRSSLDRRAVAALIRAALAVARSCSPSAASVRGVDHA